MEGDDECPVGQNCFADTSCFFDEDIVPTVSPIIEPTHSPEKSVPPTNEPVDYVSFPLHMNIILVMMNGLIYLFSHQDLYLMLLVLKE